MTRHPKLGAAEQLSLLYRNHREISGLEIFERSGAPRGSYTGAFDNLIWPTFDTFIWPTLRP